VALGLGGPVQKIWGTISYAEHAKIFRPFHAKMLWQRHVSCAWVY